MDLWRPQAKFSVVALNFCPAYQIHDQEACPLCVLGKDMRARRVAPSNFWNCLDGTSVPQQNFRSLPPAHIKPSVEMPPLNYVHELAPSTRTQWAILSSVISYVPHLQRQV